MKRLIFTAIIAALLAASPVYAQDDANKKSAAPNEFESNIVTLSDQMDSAQQGSSAAQYNLGMRYATGDGVDKDANSAFMWMHKAADQGDMDAEAALGTMYQKGQGVVADTGEAYKWYYQSAIQGNRIAQYNTGIMLASGQGVHQNDTEAYFWLTLSSSMGGSDVESQLSSLEGRLSDDKVAEIKKRAAAWEPTVKPGQQSSDIYAPSK